MRWLDAVAVGLLVVAIAIVPARPSSIGPLSEPMPTSSLASDVPELDLPDTTRSTPSPTRLPAIDTLRISIARLGIDLPLAYGDANRDVPKPGYSGNTPENVALVFPGSAPLASGGNTYVYAHARVGMFLALWNVRVGDEVVIYLPSDEGVRLRYAVSEIHPRVDPSDTRWLDPGGPERLTLQTSTGPTAQDPRFIVIALPSRPSPAAP